MFLFDYIVFVIWPYSSSIQLKFLLNGCRIERHCGSLGIRTSRHETDSEAYKADMAYSEKVTISKGLRRTSNELNKRLSSSTARNSRRSSSSPQTRSKRGSSSASESPNRRKTSTPQSSSVPASSQRRTSSAPHDVLRDTSAGPRRVGKRDGQTVCFCLLVCICASHWFCAFKLENLPLLLRNSWNVVDVSSVWGSM